MGVRRAFAATGFALGLGALSGGCSGQMADQPSVKAQEDPIMSASGSIPMNPARPWAHPVSTDSLPATNPIAVTRVELDAGERLYRDNCAFCHGTEGLGDGPVGEVYLPRPADLTSPRLSAYSDALLYERFTNGFSTMPAFYMRLSPADRWRVVAYVRSLQRRSGGP